MTWILLDNDNNQELDDLVLFLLYNLKEKEMTISHYRLQKAIFKIKKDLGENHPLNEIMPYYWYNHGPFSEYVLDSLNVIKKDFLDKNQNSYILKDEKFHDLKPEKLNISLEYPELLEIVSNLIKNRDNFYDELDKNIYKEFAPYKFLYNYKFNILNFAENNRRINDFDPEDYIDVLFDCEAKLPYDDYFNEYNDNFSTFMTTLDTLNSQNVVNEHWDILRNQIIGLWYCFSKGLRVKNKDDIYQYRTSSWDSEFKNELNILRHSIYSFSEFIRDKTNNNVTLSPKSKAILKATLGNYL